MKLTLLKPKQAINKAFLKAKPHRSEIGLFKKNLATLIENINAQESEEHVKNLLADFLKDTYYKEKHFINTKDRKDLVIHNDKTAKSSVGVLMEVKRPANTTDMVTNHDLNNRAMHELLRYYLLEREDEKNIDLKQLIVTNIYEWFIFDAADFERMFHKNKELIRQYTEWKNNQKTSSNTDLFYNEIAKTFLDKLEDEIKYTYFDIRKFNVDSSDKEEEKKLIPLYKIFSPAHLLKQSFANDSNSLDRSFYNELLHIIGLEEVKEKNKKLIKRKPEEKRDEASIIENAITILTTRDKLSRIPDIAKYGGTTEERAFNVALELCITWINRILFLKLLEAQLITYHNKDDNFKFLNEKSIKDYDELDKLFFEVLAILPEKRGNAVAAKYKLVPYLNSSLFEPNKLEQDTIFISNLDDNKSIPYYFATVLKDKNGKKLKSEKPALHYLFDFLEAYDFASEGKEEIQEENKSLINASVLGLIFEKINGYKDGSYFTPGFITMYMSRETIRRAVVQKFNVKYGWKCNDFGDLQNHIADRKNKNEILEANKVVNSLTICDPAVGSGHFLVSALNEIIAVKSELGILADETGVRLTGYDVKIENDELIVTYAEGTEIFEYHIHSGKPHDESQRIQKTLFHEKQRIIENSLFGVDINPNSVKIARLRLWIELLKNAFYTEESKFLQLETLPNIDINIKLGNSLISRFPIDTDLKQVLKTVKWKIEDYRTLVYEYKNAHEKERKHAVQDLIKDIKENFRTEISARDPKRKTLNNLSYELHDKYQADRLIEVEMTDKQKEKQKKEEDKLIKKIEKLSDEIKEIEEGEIYRDAFEWRFEFPEVLADNGDYIGFDIVIGNPPYIRGDEIKEIKNYLSKEYKVFNGMGDLYTYFYEIATRVAINDGLISLITSNKFIRSNYGQSLRRFLSHYRVSSIVDFGELPVFEDASTFPMIFRFNKHENLNEEPVLSYSEIDSLDSECLDIKINRNKIDITHFSCDSENWQLINANEKKIFEKMYSNGISLHDYTDGQIKFGIKTGFNEAFIVDEVTKDALVAEDGNSADLLKPLLRGKDVQKYFTQFNKLWLITTFPAKKIDISKFPAIKNHLLKYGKERLEQSGKKGSRKKTKNNWFETQDIISYWSDFENPKIIYPDIALEPRFTLDNNCNYPDATLFIIPKSDKYLLGILNSQLIWFFLSKNCPVIGSENNRGRLRLKTVYISKLPIIEADPLRREALSHFVEQILIAKAKNPQADTSALEREIDELVYKLYGLTYEEVKIVDPEIVLTEKEYNNLKID